MALEQSGRVLETPNLDTAKFGQKRRNFDLQPGRGGGRGSAKFGAKFAAKFCGEIFVLVLRIFHPPKKFATDPPPQISLRPCPKNSGLSRPTSVRGLRQRI